MQLNQDKAFLQPFLNRLLLRTSLSRIEQHEILSLPFSSVQVRRHRDYVRFGQEVDHACVVAAGLIGRFDQNVRGDRQITAIHVPGDMANLTSVVQPEATSALQALTTSTLLRVPHGSLREIACRYPPIGEAFWRDSIVDMRVLGQWLLNSRRRDAKSRIAHLLCEMAVRLGAKPTENKLRLTLPLVQSQIAEACGLTTVHVNRSLKALARHGTSLCNRVLIIQNWAELAAIGEFNPAYLR